MIRGNITNFGNVNGKETAEVTVRAGSKPGAVVAARLRAMSIIPMREQAVGEIRNMSNMRFFDQWVVTIQDKKELENVGR